MINLHPYELNLTVTVTVTLPLLFEVSIVIDSFVIDHNYGEYLTGLLKNYCNVKFKYNFC